MKFNSQLSTTKEQSERLLALGLKQDTADMHHYQYVYGGRWAVAAQPSIAGYNNRLVPAWSLHRLIEMLTYQVIYNDAKYEPVIAIDGMAYQDVCIDDPIVGWSGDLYTDVIDCIEWLIKEGYFNKEYLE